MAQPATYPPQNLTLPTLWPTLGARLVILAAVIMTATLLPANAVVLSYVVLGHAHFFLTYMDQNARNAYTASSMMRYGALLGFAFAICSLNAQGFVFFTGVFFLLHNFFDDMKLLASSRRADALAITAPIVVFTACFSCDALFKTDIAVWGAFIAAAMYVITFAYCFARDSLRDPYVGYLAILTPVLFAVTLSLETARPEKLFGIIILSHYANWYYYIYRRNAAIAPQKQGIFLKQTVLCNLAIAGAFFGLLAYGNINGVPLLKIPAFKAFFEPDSFYVWTIMHLIVTVRPQDYALEKQ